MASIYLSPDDRILPLTKVVAAIGDFLFAFTMLGFTDPGWLINIWPRKLTPLTARVISG